MVATRVMAMVATLVVMAVTRAMAIRGHQLHRQHLQLRQQASNS